MTLFAKFCHLIGKATFCTQKIVTAENLYSTDPFYFFFLLLVCENVLRFYILVSHCASIITKIL